MPETNTVILEAKRRARDYWDIDGLPALRAGAIIVLWGVFWPSTGMRGSVLAMVVLAVWILSRKKRGILEWLKDRITYPRTGYVAPLKADQDSERDPYTILSIIKEPEVKEPQVPLEGRASTKAIELEDIPFFVTLVWIFVDNNWVVPFNRGLISLACLVAAISFWRKNKKDPPWFEIAGAAIAGTVNAVLQMSGKGRIGISLFVFGVAIMAKGATLLIRYLRQHPAPAA
jgi:hypothetical protein